MVYLLVVNFILGLRIVLIILTISNKIIICLLSSCLKCHIFLNLKKHVYLSDLRVLFNSSDSVNSFLTVKKSANKNVIRRRK